MLCFLAYTVISLGMWWNYPVHGDWPQLFWKSDFLFQNGQHLFKAVWQLWKWKVELSNACLVAENINRMQKHSLQPDRDYEEKWPNMVLLQHSKMPLQSLSSTSFHHHTQVDYNRVYLHCCIFTAKNPTSSHTQPLPPPPFFFKHKVVPWRVPGWWLEEAPPTPVQLSPCQRLSLLANIKEPIYTALLWEGFQSSLRTIAGTQVNTEGILVWSLLHSGHSS